MRGIEPLVSPSLSHGLYPEGAVRTSEVEGPATFSLAGEMLARWSDQNITSKPGDIRNDNGAPRAGNGIPENQPGRTRGRLVTGQVGIVFC
jgi:hypothetical protein